jgi:hypothetical protein
MYLGTIYVSTKFRPVRTSNMAARWPSWKTNEGARIHDIIPVFLFDLLFKVTEVNVQNILQSWLVLLLFDLECSSFVLINHPTQHLSYIVAHATIPMSRHLDLRWAHGPWTISLDSPFLTLFFSCYKGQKASFNFLAGQTNKPVWKILETILLNIYFKSKEMKWAKTFPFYPLSLSLTVLSNSSETFDVMQYQDWNINWNV